MLNQYEDIPGTWSHLLKANWLAFNEVIKDMNDSPEKLSHIKLRAYVLYDMQKRHNNEKKTLQKID
jgi:hypothetical protein